MKNLELYLLKRTSLLRLVNLFGSLIFLPAYYFGLASIWGVFFAFFLALFLKGSFNVIINNFKELADKNNKSWRVLCAYTYLSLEMVFYIILGPSLFILLGLEPYVLFVDKALLDYSLVLIFVDSTYETLTKHTQWLVASSWPAFWLMPFVFIFAWKEARQLADWTLYRRNNLNSKEYDSSLYADYDAYASFALIGSFVVHLVYVHNFTKAVELQTLTLVSSCCYLLIAALISQLTIALFFTATTAEIHQIPKK